MHLVHQLSDCYRIRTIICQFAVLRVNCVCEILPKCQGHTRLRRYTGSSESLENMHRGHLGTDWFDSRAHQWSTRMWDYDHLDRPLADRLRTLSSIFVETYSICREDTSFAHPYYLKDLVLWKCTPDPVRLTRAHRFLQILNRLFLAVEQRAFLMVQPS